MSYTNCIVLTCPETWMLTRISNYLNHKSNITRWQRQFGDKTLSVSCEQQDQNMMFITIYTTNLFVSYQFLKRVVSKIHDGICLLQNSINENVKIDTMYRYDNKRFENHFVNGVCSSEVFNNYIQPTIV
jgi:hypothetical protein